MKKNDVWVISLGGSRIVPDNVDSGFLLRFKKLLDSHKDKKFVVVCGGGSTARRYIRAFRKLGLGTKAQSMEGIAVTRLHAGFLARFFGREANEDLPSSIKKVRNLLRGNRVVFCGTLRYSPRNTSDGTAAKLAGFLGCPFINLTNVRGLYSSNPKTTPLDSKHRTGRTPLDSKHRTGRTPLDSKHRTGRRKVKFISRISWDDFYDVARKVKFEAGQHFVLDGAAARVIRDRKIVTYIVGSLAAMDSILKGAKRFNGTMIGY